MKDLPSVGQYRHPPNRVRPFNQTDHPNLGLRGRWCCRQGRRPGSIPTRDPWNRTSVHFRVTRRLTESKWIARSHGGHGAWLSDGLQADVELSLPLCIGCRGGIHAARWNGGLIPGCFRNQLLLLGSYLVLTKPLSRDILRQRCASVKIGRKYLDNLSLGSLRQHLMTETPLNGIGTLRGQKGSSIAFLSPPGPAKIVEHSDQSGRDSRGLYSSHGNSGKGFARPASAPSGHDTPDTRVGSLAGGVGREDMFRVRSLSLAHETRQRQARSSGCGGLVRGDLSGSPLSFLASHRHHIFLTTSSSFAAPHSSHPSFGRDRCEW